MKRALLSTVVLSALLLLVAGSGAQEEREKRELKSALLVIDIQNIWLPHMAEEDRATAPDSINMVIDLFRKYDRPVIRIYHTDLTRGPEPGTEPFEFPNTIAVRDDDIQIIKHYPSSFTKTALDSVLTELDCNTVFLCGLSATGCVLATYFGAMERDYLAVMVQGALISPNASHTTVIEDICASTSIKETERYLKDPYL